MSYQILYVLLSNHLNLSIIGKCHNIIAVEPFSSSSLLLLSTFFLTLFENINVYVTFFLNCDNPEETYDHLFLQNFKNSDIFNLDNLFLQNSKNSDIFNLDNERRKIICPVDWVFHFGKQITKIYQLFFHIFHKHNIHSSNCPL